MQLMAVMPNQITSPVEVLASVTHTSAARAAASARGAQRCSRDSPLRQGRRLGESERMVPVVPGARVEDARGRMLQDAPEGQVPDLGSHRMDLVPAP